MRLLQRLLWDAGYDEERMIVHIFLPKKGDPPYQTIVYFPDDGAFILSSISEYGYEE